MEKSICTKPEVIYAYENRLLTGNADELLYERMKDIFELKCTESQRKKCVGEELELLLSASKIAMSKAYPYERI